MRVTVAPADDHPGDLIQRVALVDAGTLATLDVAAGDPLVVRGDDETVVSVRVWEDGPGSTVALAPVDCRNAGVSPGETVTVEATDPPPAEGVTLRLAEDPGLGNLGLQGGLSAVRRAVEGHPLSPGDRVSLSLLGGSLAVPFVTTETIPDGPVLVSADTEINVKHSPAETDTLSIPRSVTAEDLGGLDETLATLRRAVVLPLDRPDVFEQFGREPPAVLVHGPPGSGKTSAGVALGTEADARFLPVVPGGEYHDPGTSVDVAAIRETATRAPTLVFFDDLDVLAPAQQGGETDASAVALSRLVDDLRDADGVTMLATAAAPEGVAAPLRRGDRFGREVAIKTPDRDARREILDVHFAGVPLSGVALDWIADRTPGFVAADIAQLVSESILQAIERLAGDSPRSLPPDSVVRQPDVEAALAAVSPSGLRDHTVEQPDVTYDDIGGLADVKRDLVRTVEWPLIYPDLFDRVQSDPPTGILLYGPPGTGKTMLARAVATSSGANFLAVSGPELFDRYVGESERAVRDVFDRARQNAPAVVFFDEIDALATRRDAAEENDVSDRVVSQLLTELDGIEPRTGVTVVGATNRPDLIDRALLRPGRFEKVLEVPLPDREARSEIFSTHLEDVPAVAAGIDVEPLAGATEGYSGSDIAAVVREAGLLAMEESLRATSFDGDTAARSVEVTQAHLRRAVETVDRSVTETMREEYESRADDLRT